MKKRNRIQPEERSLQDKAYDLLGEMIMERETERLTRELAERKAQGDTAEMDAFFARQNQRYQTRLYDYCHKQRVRRFFTHSLPRFGQAAAIVIAVLTLAGGAAVASSAMFRVQVMKLLATTEQEHTSLQLVADESASFDVPMDWQGRYYPSYIPEGMEIADLLTTGDEWFYVQYKNPVTNGKIIFEECGDGVTTNIDTENAILRQVEITGCSGTMVIKGEVVQIWWSDGQKYFTLLTIDITEQESLRIAQSIRSVK